MIHSGNTNPLTKHVGFCNDKRCAIILQLPEEPHLVHVVDTESLPTQLHQNLMDIINLPEAQATQWLGDVLNRKMLADGTNALRSLYERQYVKQVPVDQVMLAPRPNMRVPLREILQVYADPLGATQNPMAERDAGLNRIAVEEQAKLDAYGVDPVQPPADPVRPPVVPIHNQHLENLAGDKVANNALIANNLLAEAQMLEAEASRKRAQAAQYGAVVTPPVAPAPVVPSTVPAQAAQFVDPVTGRSYKTEGALKGAMTRRQNAANG